MTDHEPYGAERAAKRQEELSAKRKLMPLHKQKELAYYEGLGYPWRKHKNRGKL